MEQREDQDHFLPGFCLDYGSIMTSQIDRGMLGVPQCQCISAPLIAAPSGGYGGTTSLPVTTNEWHVGRGRPDPENDPRDRAKLTF